MFTDGVLDLAVCACVCSYQMQQQELAQMRHREANLTALAAIGPRKKRKILDSPSSSSAAAEVTSADALHLNTARREMMEGKKKLNVLIGRFFSHFLLTSTVAGGWSDTCNYINEMSHRHIFNNMRLSKLENIQSVCLDHRQTFVSYPVCFLIWRSLESHLTITDAMCSFPVYTLGLQIWSVIVKKKKDQNLATWSM